MYIWQSQTPDLHPPPHTPLFPFGNHVCFLSLWVCSCFVNKSTCILFLDFIYKGYHTTLIFLWLTSLSAIASIHAAANGTISFFSTAQEYSLVSADRIFFIHSSVDGHLGCFHVLDIIISIAVFSGYMLRGRIAGSYGSSIFFFLKDPAYSSPWWQYQFTFPPTRRVHFSPHALQGFWW